MRSSLWLISLTLLSRPVIRFSTAVSRSRCAASSTSILVKRLSSNVQTDGKVGIGTSSPKQLLHIEGQTPRLRLQDNNPTSDGICPYRLLLHYLIL